MPLALHGSHAHAKLGVDRADKPFPARPALKTRFPFNL
jgi:hypothetical protein